MVDVIELGDQPTPPPSLPAKTSRSSGGNPTLRFFLFFVFVFVSVFVFFRTANQNQNQLLGTIQYVLVCMTAEQQGR